MYREADYYMYPFKLGILMMCLLGPLPKKYNTANLITSAKPGQTAQAQGKTYGTVKSDLDRL